jgi:hypothetical protein
MLLQLMLLVSVFSCLLLVNVSELILNQYSTGQWLNREIIIIIIIIIIIHFPLGKY